MAADGNLKHLLCVATQPSGEEPPQVLRAGAAHLPSLGECEQLNKVRDVGRPEINLQICEELAGTDITVVQPAVEVRAKIEHRQRDLMRGCHLGRRANQLPQEICCQRPQS